MRTLIFLTALLFAAFPLKIISSETDTIVYENDSMFTIQDYKDSLSEYGEWIKVNKEDIDPDGVSEGSDELDDNLNTDYVWRPYGVDESWTPYTNGYWIYTNCGWMWVSYYQWGWRTCHYGRWWWSPVWGWVWSPGYVWAPAWVVWMYSGDYCGWYPISPRVRWHHHHGWRCHHMRFHKRRWAFCHTNNFHNPVTVVIDPMYNGEIINKTKFINSVGVAPGGVKNTGPSLTDVEKYTGKKYEVTDVTKYNNSDKFKEYKDAGRKDKINTKDETKTINRTDTYKDKNDNSTKEPNKNNEKKPDINKDKQDNNTKEAPKKETEKKQYNPPPKQKDDSQKKSYTPPPKQKDESKKSYDPPKKDGSQKSTYTPPKQKDDSGNKNNDSPPPKKDDSGKKDSKGK